MLPNHGANPAQLYEQLDIPMPAEIIDFSENVNPLRSPITLTPEEIEQAISVYPHPKGEPFLSEVAAFHHCAKENVLLGNGAAEIFTFLAAILRNKQVLLVEPTFSEYEATLRAQHATIHHVDVTDIVHYTLPMEAIYERLPQMDALYVCTPNNPTGVLPPRVQIMQLIQWATTFQTLLILDEAFVDWLGEEYSFAEEATRNPFVIVVRSMTKMYKIPGVRLGYAIAHESRIEQLQAFASHWHINGIAIALGTKLLHEEEYRAQAIEMARVSRETIFRKLHKMGYRYTKSTTNFVTFQLANPEQSDAFFEQMLRQGIVLRHTKNFRGLDGKWFRIGMKSTQQMTRLETEMSAWEKIHGSS